MRLILICLVLAEAFLSPAFAHTGVGQVEFIQLRGRSSPQWGRPHPCDDRGWSLERARRWPRGLGVADDLRCGDAGRFRSGAAGPANPIRRSGDQPVDYRFRLARRSRSQGAAFGWVQRSSDSLHSFMATLTERRLAATGAIPYAAGFAFATAALHAAGVGVGLCARSSIARTALRAKRRIRGVGRIILDGKLT